MAQGFPGVDSSEPASEALLGQAKEFFGQAPQFWARYFKGPDTDPAHASAIYRPEIENPLFSAWNIRILPIGQQTRRVSGSQAEGMNDGSDNGRAVIAAFGPDTLSNNGVTTVGDRDFGHAVYFMFLDVEGTPENGSGFLSPEYFSGWAQGLRTGSLEASNNTVEILPCVYGRTLDSTSWKAIADSGQECFGAWVARVHQTNCDGLTPTDWDAAFCEQGMDTAFPILVWQFGWGCPFGGSLDVNQSNPNMPDTSLVQYLPLL
jgi:hypothetical protein